MDERPNTAAVVELRARHVEFDCPHCGIRIDGWVSDPRGQTDTCDKCKESYTVATDAIIKIN